MACINNFNGINCSGAGAVFGSMTYANAVSYGSYTSPKESPQIEEVQDEKAETTYTSIEMGPSGEELVLAAKSTPPFEEIPTAWLTKLLVSTETLLKQINNTWSLEADTDTFFTDLAPTSPTNVKFRVCKIFLALEELFDAFETADNTWGHCATVSSSGSITVYGPGSNGEHIIRKPSGVVFVQDAGGHMTRGRDGRRVWLHAYHGHGHIDWRDDGETRIVCHDGRRVVIGPSGEFDCYESL